MSKKLQVVVPGMISRYEGTDNEMSWLLATELGHASELVHDFYLQYPD